MNDTEIQLTIFLKTIMCDYRVWYFKSKFGKDSTVLLHSREEVLVLVVLKGKPENNRKKYEGYVCFRRMIPFLVSYSFGIRKIYLNLNRS